MSATWVRIFYILPLFLKTRNPNFDFRVLIFITTVEQGNLKKKTVCFNHTVGWILIRSHFIFEMIYYSILWHFKNVCLLFLMVHTYNILNFKNMMFFYTIYKKKNSREKSLCFTLHSYVKKFMTYSRKYLTQKADFCTYCFTGFTRVYFS